MEESPFASSSGTFFTLYIEPILNTYFQTYQNVITLSAMPNGPLANMVTMISVNKLSPFQQNSVFSAPFSCVYVLLRYPVQSSKSSIKNMDYFMTAEDIPSVIAYLTQQGYIVDTQMTQLVHGHSHEGILVGGTSERRISGMRKLIAMVRHTG
jgi:hypothetical protein